MERQIPIYFDSIVINSPVQEIIKGNSQSSIYHMKVRVFSKYANRNGSYITDAVADSLIESATKGITPVIGFFDPETKTWASHTGPTLAKAYGYVESFLGWEPFKDTDGITRDYAVFSVIVFADYFEEAKDIFGQNQSMELDYKSITGDWAEINNDWYYVYTTAKIAGFCIIGSHEPCFSVSAFFSQDENHLNTQYEKFFSLLAELKAEVEDKTVEEAQPMNEFEEQEQVTPVEEEQVIEEVAESAAEFEENAPVEEDAAESEPEVVEEPAPEQEEAAEEPSEFEVLQNNFNELQNNFSELQQQFAAAQETIASLNAQLESANAERENLNTIIANHEATIAGFNLQKKHNLIENYEKVIGEEEIVEFRAMINDISYEELESKLAIAFANKQMAGGEFKKVTLPDQEQSQFALLMNKYRKN